MQGPLGTCLGREGMSVHQGRGLETRRTGGTPRRQETAGVTPCREPDGEVCGAPERRAWVLCVLKTGCFYFVSKIDSSVEAKPRHAEAAVRVGRREAVAPLRQGLSVTEVREPRAGRGSL